MSSVTPGRGATKARDLSITPETIAANADLAWRMELNKSTREAIDLRINELIGYLNWLGRQPLGEDQDPNIQALLRLVERHLSPEHRPTDQTLAHYAHGYMRETAVLVKTVLGHYLRTNGGA